MALVAAFGLKTTHLDAMNTFLNAINDEAIYCHMPDGWKIPGKILRVIKALYGQRKSPLLWLRHLSKTCLAMGLMQIPGEPCLFTNGDGVFLFFYVDDIVIAYRPDKTAEMHRYASRLKSIYEIKDLSEMAWFLGVRIIREKGTISLVQDSYIDKIIKTYGIEASAKTPATPLPFPANLAPYEGEVDADRTHEYRQKVGSICYPAVMTRPDVAKTASKLSEFLTNPGPNHVQAADHCLAYLRATKFLGIEFSASGGGELSVQSAPPDLSTSLEYSASSPTYQEKHVFEATNDASYADSTRRKSSEGYTFKLFGGLIDWASRKQLTISTSTTEAELLAVLHAGKEALYWTHLFNKLGFNPGHRMLIFNDNLQAIRLLNSEIGRLNTKLRHVDIAQCWLRQYVQLGHLSVDYLPTSRMVSDGLTKLLPPQKHRDFIR